VFRPIPALTLPDQALQGNRRMFNMKQGTIIAKPTGGGRMRKLALAALSFSAAVFLSRYLLPDSWLFYGAAVCAALALAGFVFKPPFRTRLMIAGFALAAGFLWTALYAAVFVRPADVLAGTTQTVSAHALTAPEETDYGFRISVAVCLDGAPTFKTRLYVFGDDPGILPGNTLSFTARFTAADTVYGEETDGYYAKGIYLLAYAEGGVAVTDVRTGPIYWPAYLADLSGRMIGRVFPDDVRGFMYALLLATRPASIRIAFYLPRWRPPAFPISWPCRGCACRFSSASSASSLKRSGGSRPAPSPSSSCSWPSSASERLWRARASCRFSCSARPCSSARTTFTRRCRRR
jgi:hypothetical protein